MDMENQKVKNNIPNDLTWNILSKLPVKSLKRFKCVHKSWANLDEDPHFIRMHFENLISKNDDSHLLLRQHVRDENLFLLSGDKYENKVKLDWPAPVQEDPRGIIIYGACVNGIICLCQRIRSDQKVVLWNPTTEEVDIIPSGVVQVPGFDFLTIFHGFGYDHVTNDYKLIQYVCCFIDSHYEFIDEEPIPLVVKEPFWQIYSLKSKCWKNLSHKMTPRYYSPTGSSVYLNGACHWWGEDDHDKVNEEIGHILVSFDISSEMFRVTPIARRRRYHYFYRYLTVLKGYVAIISEVAETKCFDLSILGEVGVKESWVKLFTIGPFPFVEYPIGIGIKGDIFFRKKDGELVWFDSGTKVIEETGIYGDFLSQTMIYKESLLQAIN